MQAYFNVGSTRPDARYKTMSSTISFFESFQFSKIQLVEGRHVLWSAAKFWLAFYTSSTLSSSSWLYIIQSRMAIYNILKTNELIYCFVVSWMVTSRNIFLNCPSLLTWLTPFLKHIICTCLQFKYIKSGVGLWSTWFVFMSPDKIVFLQHKYRSEYPYIEARFRW